MLEIDSDDVAIYMAETPHMVLELHLDYFGRSTKREMEIYMDDDTIRVDFIKQAIDFEVRGRHLEFHEDRDDYQKRELQHFFDITRGVIENDNDLNMACRTLRLARGEL